MKKIMVFVLITVITVLLCSCGIPVQKRECFSLPENFVCDYYAAENGKEFAGKIEKSNDSYTVTVSSPNEMSGITLKYANGEFDISDGSKEMKYTPEDSFFIKDIIEFIKKNTGSENLECEIRDNAYIISQNEWKLIFREEKVNNN